jgi:excisionase family DNA binding protein
MKTENRRSEPSAGFATSTETAEFLKISKSLVNKLVAEGQIPSCRFGRSVRIPWSWLLEKARSV